MKTKDSFKVDFVVIGAPKSATTTLTSILRQQPDIGYSKDTATEFFSKQKNPLEHIALYHSKFPISEHKKVYGETSTTYSFYPTYGEAMYKEMFEYNPELKFIYLVRDPIARTYSQYLHWLERGYTDLPLLAALKEVPEILNTSKYYLQISQYLQYYPMEQIFVESFENFNHQRAVVLDTLAQFLGIDNQGFTDYENVFENASWDGSKRHHRYDRMKENFQWIKPYIPKKMIQPIWDSFTKNTVVNKEKPELDEESAIFIRQALDADIQQFKNLMNRDFKEWKQFNAFK